LQDCGQLSQQQLELFVQVQPELGIAVYTRAATVVRGRNSLIRELVPNRLLILSD
jgi:hypothetical protein